MIANMVIVSTYIYIVISYKLYIIVMLAFFLLGNERSLDKGWMEGSGG